MTSHEVAAALPEIHVLRDRCRALATLEAILSPDWEDRYYSFDSHWAPGEEMASMRNGSGDSWSIVFTPDGVFVRGFDHESPMSPAANGGVLWPGLIEGIPDVFLPCINEPAFSSDGVPDATACIWRRALDSEWHVGVPDRPDGDDPDGADWLFAILLDGTATSYREFAEDYYEVDLDENPVDAVFALQPLTDELVQRLNPDMTLDELGDDLAEIGYPSAI
ncbi:hypothetical protein ACPPVS_08500 [Cellulomonas sp. McL0617]|uniref:hypothetical protein n=1 Tax=Cellulomonas sp. McL0617 TaxID=3415675 RepID=UPI003CF5A410